MALSTEDAWTKFFKTADLEDAQATKYAKIMVTNRVTRTEYLDNKEILKELGITSIGDILNIIRNAKKDAKKICEQTVQSSIIASYPNFFESDEDTNLNDIEAIVTKSSNPAVHHLTFSNLTQS